MAYDLHNLFLDSCILAGEESCHRSPLWFGKSMGKDISDLLSLLKALMDRKDDRFNEGLPVTRFPDGFDGQAAFLQ